MGGPLVQKKADREARQLLRVFAQVSRAIEDNPADVYAKVREHPDVPKAGAGGVPEAAARAVRSAEDAGLLELIAADGRPLLQCTALPPSGLRHFLSMRREFLPHDVAFLGMTSDQLCAVGTAAWWPSCSTIGSPSAGC